MLLVSVLKAASDAAPPAIWLQRLARAREAFERKGIEHIPEFVEPIRNNDVRRTPEKRAFLRATYDRAVEAGEEPSEGYW